MLLPLPRWFVVGFLLAISPTTAADADEAPSHWAFQAPRRPELPEVKESDWVRNPVDRFLLAGLESIEFRHSP
jgi:hypothetical protein